MATPPPLPTEAPATAAPPPAKQGGCLRGCLWGCLVVIILGVATPVVVVGVAYFVGRPYVARHLPAWRAGNPLLDAVVAYTEVDRYFLVSPAQPADPGGRKPGQVGRGALPIDVPLAQDPIDEAVNANESEVSVFQAVSSPPRVAAGFWREGMAARG